MVSAAVGYADYASEVMADGPEAYYRFEESAGATSVADHSGNGHGSTAVSDVIFGEAGAVGKAGTCSNGYVRLDLQLSPAADDFSIEAIARFDVSDEARTFVSQDDGAGDGRILLSRNSGGQVFTRLGGEFNGSSSTIGQGAWHHIVMTVEKDTSGSAETIRFYINGQLAGSRTATAEFANGNWKLGSGMIGALDEVAIYTKVLSAERVADHHTAVTPVVEHTGNSPTHYVSTTGSGTYPYTSWTTAARFIQDAVDAAAAGDTVLVTNGTYSSASEISVTKAITIEGVNGREVTIIDGLDDHRCFNLGNSACTLSGFTIQNGNSIYGNGGLDGHLGGGVYCSGTNPLITHCTLSGNLAGENGGGSYEGTLNHCTLSGNEAGDKGGGSYSGTLNNCVISANEAGFGGGSAYGTLNNCTLMGNDALYEGGGSYQGSLKNCILWHNMASNTGGNWHDPTPDFDHCCSSGLSGTGNITADPQFLDAGGGDIRLKGGSPCIDAGATVAGITDDLDGNPRPIDGNFDSTASYDMGAYEYNPATTDSDSDGRMDDFEQQQGLDMFYDESSAISYGEAAGEASVTNNPAAYDLYTTNSIMDLDLGLLMLQASNTTMRMSLQLEQCTNLTDNVWTNAGDAVNWQLEAPGGKAFFRVRGRE